MHHADAGCRAALQTVGNNVTVHTVTFEHVELTPFRESSLPAYGCFVYRGDNRTTPSVSLPKGNDAADFSEIASSFGRRR